MTAFGTETGDPTKRCEKVVKKCCHYTLVLHALRIDSRSVSPHDHIYVCVFSIFHELCKTPQA